MKKIAFHIQKGGVGKTSISGNVAVALASSGRRVCLVDGDPQGSVSSWLLSDCPHELADVLTGTVPASEALAWVSEHLAIIPTAGIGGGLKAFAETRLFQQPFIFDDLAASLDGFEYLIYDLSPGMSQLERCIILSCDEVISPLTPEYFSTDGLEIFTAELAAINKNYRRNVLHRRIVANNVNMSFAQHRDRLEWFKGLDYSLHIIPQDRGIADSQAMHQSIFQYAPQGRAAGAILELAGAL